MRLIAVSALGLGIAGAVVAACVSTPAAPAPPSVYVIPGLDAGLDAASPPATDASPDATLDASPDAVADAADASPGDAQVSPFNVIGSIPLAGSPSATAFNLATNTLYVALNDSSDPSAGVGIAVIDGATNTLAATIPYPGSGTTYPIVEMAVDILSNTLYAADSNPAGQTLYVIDGTANTVTTTIAIGSDLGMQVDSTAHRVYVLGSGAPAIPDGGTGAVPPATITIIDDTTNDAGAPLAIADEAISSASGIALDPIQHRLYLCGPNAAELSKGTPNVAADTLDTTNALAPLAAQRTLTGQGSIACLAGWGGGAVVTTGSATVDFLDTTSLPLPAGFAPTTAAGAGALSPQKANVVVFGSNASNVLEVVAATENTDGGVSVSLAPTPATDDASISAASWRTVTLANASAGIVQAYLTYTTSTDGGAAAPSVLYASVIAQ